MEIASTYPTPSQLTVHDDGQIGPTTCKTLDQGSWKIYSLDQRTFMHPSIHPSSHPVYYVILTTCCMFCLTLHSKREGEVYYCRIRWANTHTHVAVAGRFPVNVMSRLSEVCDTQMVCLSSGSDGQHRVQLIIVQFVLENHHRITRSI